MKITHILIVALVALSAALFFSGSKSNETELYLAIDKAKAEMDSLNVVNKGLTESNDELNKEIICLGLEKEEVIKKLNDKEVKIEEVKDKKHGKIEQIIYGKDSTIIDILSNYEYKQLLAKSKTDR